MHIEKVNLLDPKSTERTLKLRSQIVCVISEAEIAPFAVTPDACFGCNREMRRIVFEKPADDLLGQAHSIDIRGIQQVDPQSLGRGQGVMGIFLIGGSVKPRKAHATKPDCRDLFA